MRIKIKVNDIQNATEEFINSLKQSAIQMEEIPLMQYIYKNNNTKSYIDFEVEGVKNNMPPNLAIEVFLHKVSKEDYTLPSSLLRELKDEDLDLFLQAPFNDKILEELEEYIYVHKEHESYTDEYGFEYDVIERSKKEVVLEYADAHSCTTIVVDGEEFLFDPRTLRGIVKDYSQYTGF